MSRQVIRRLAVRATLALVLVAVAGGGVAQADVSMGENGSTGAHWLKEPPHGPSDGYGAWCIYDLAAHRLSHVWVRQPVIFAHDAHAGTGNDPQVVGYAVRIQRKNGSAWVTLWTSPIHKKPANDNVRANFGNASNFVDYPVTQIGLRLRAVVQMFWFTPGSTTAVSGSSTHLVQTYAKAFENADVAEVEPTPCAPTRA